jgi:histone deacetylase 11
MKLPLIFHPKYDIGLFRLENRHPFDSKKYGKVFRFLQEKEIIVGDNYFEPESKADNDVMLGVHTQEYLDSLRHSATVAKIAELSFLRFLPNFLLQSNFLNPMRWATAGTILAVDLAMEYGWAINLSGGYHHAKSDRSSGFCFFADINLAAKRAFSHFPNVKKILVIDLDAHQGNGFEAIFENDPSVDVFDMYNGDIYPMDLKAAQHIRWKFPLDNGTGEIDYISILQNNLPKAIAESKPDLIIYNAGTDPYEKDPLGGLRISAAGLVLRDEFVFRQANQGRIPIVMVLSGGYHPDSASIIGSSINNLWNKGLLVESKAIVG